MILKAQLPELSHYKNAEERLPLNEDLFRETLITPNDNITLPGHRWFKFKESFSANLLSDILKDIVPALGKNIRLLDPFCGVGTSLLASQELSAYGYHIESVGIERNPFIAFVARTKSSWPEISVDSVHEIAERVLSEADDYSGPIPSLSSLTTGRCLSLYYSRRILSIQDKIRCNGSGPSHDALLLGLASAIESVSKTRKDGRALRIVGKGRAQLTRILKARWQAIADDVTFLKTSFPKSDIPCVLEGDGRRPSLLGVGPHSIDLVLTSPPYPNNIDYSEVYKLELWLLGFIKDHESFLQLRKETFRSHPTCSDPDKLDDFMVHVGRGNIAKILNPVLKRMKESKEPWRQKVLLGYFHDIWISLKEQYRCLRDGGYAVLVVGNSMHGGRHFPYLIPTDILVGTLGELAGFEVKNVMIARSLKRRLVGNHFLRESIVVLKKKK